VNIKLIRGASILLLVSVQVNASLILYDNGPITDDSASGNCDGDDSCGNGQHGGWFFIDNFILESDATVTSFSYSSWLYSGSITDYSGTDWLFYDAEPVNNPAPVIASGSSVATYAVDDTYNNLFHFEVTGLDLTLSADTVYWLGISNNDVFTTAAQVDPIAGPLTEAIQSDGLVTYNSGVYDRAFSIYGDVSPVPIPATVWLFGTALIGLVGFSRRKKSD
jgi:hypothetical protein